MKHNEGLAYVCRALAYQAKQDFERAMTDCDQAIALVPNEVPPYLVRGAIHQAKNRLDDAIKDFTQAISNDRDRAYSYLARGKAYRAAKKDELSISDLSHSLELDPSNINAYVELAHAYRNSGDSANAIRAYSGAIERDKNHAATYFFRARLFFDRQSIERTISDCESAIKLDEAFASAHGLLAAAYYSQKDFGKAAGSLKKVANLAPMPSVLLWLGKSHYENGEYQAAIEAFDRAIKIDGKYIPAFLGRALTENKLEQKDKAAADNKTAQQLASASNVQQDAAAIKLTALVDGLYSVTKGLSTESLQSQAVATEKKPSSMDLVVESSKTAADNGRKKTTALQQTTVENGAEMVAPAMAKEASDSLQRANDLFAKQQYEFAKLHFRMAEVQYGEILDQFDKRARSDANLWLAWAKQKAEDISGSKSAALVYATLAFACHHSGDQDGYAEWMRKAVSKAKSRGIADPAAAATTMLMIADMQEDCQDIASALKSVRDAAAFCEGVQPAGTRSVRYGECAGHSARLGDQHTWDHCLQEARTSAEQADNQRNKSQYPQRNYVSCVAYAEALDRDKAVSIAKTLQSKRSWSELAAPAYARITLSVAKNYNASNDRILYETSYITACMELSLFRDPHWPNAAVARGILARADTRIGNCDRALVAAINTPSPEDRRDILGLIMQKKVEQKDFDGARALSTLLPQMDSFSSADYWLAQAEAREERGPMTQLRQWAGKRSTPSDCVMALAGVAATIKQAGILEKDVVKEPARGENAKAPQHAEGSGQRDALSDKERRDEAIAEAASALRKNRDDHQACDAFDRNGAASPDWWLRQAKVLTKAEDSPALRAALWTRVALVYAQEGDNAAAKSCLGHARQSAMTLWCNLAAEHRGASLNFNGNYQWDDDSRKKESEETNSVAVLDALMSIEEVQRQVSDKSGATDTLLLVLQGAGVLPNGNRNSTIIASKSKRHWIARVAGRLSLCGRQDLADLILAENPWSQDKERYNTEELLKGVAAAEARNATELANMAAVFQKPPVCNSEMGAPRAAFLYTQLAILAACNADEDGYRKAAMVVGGLVNSRGQTSAPRSNLIGLAHAAAIMGEVDMALEYIDQYGSAKPNLHEVWAAMAVEKAKRGQVARAEDLTNHIQNTVASVPAWAAVATAEASVPSCKLSAMLQKIDSQSLNAQKAASMFGVASALLKKK